MTELVSDAEHNGRANGLPETVDITPSPRILKLVAEIEFQPWQCVCELIDNSFDELLDIQRNVSDWTEPSEVSVTLPSPTTPVPEASIVIQDNGRGMTLEQVRNAVRAGFTGRDPVNNLGLFGMGFNVATARLGGVTRFLTTREGDADWIGVEIDVDNIGESFQAPVIREPKSSPDEHGTQVEVRRLTKLAEWLTKPVNQSGLRKRLGGIYSQLLDGEGFRLDVNGIRVKPWRHCVWSDERSVVRGRETIPAIIKIDETLGERAVCRVCGTWQAPQNDECEQCESRALEVRTRRVHGWVGIARELDRREFGLDFLRNGRKILRFDKTIFGWVDPEDPSGEAEIEYPIEVPASQGRIVGEIHLDHVRVTYTKDSFDTHDPAWNGAVRILRGDGPLQPKKAENLGYARNDSPLARLYRGYRRNDPGRAYLMAGTGAAKRARMDTSEWVQKFHEGDSEYQTDEKWWEAVVQHDELVERRREQGRQTDVTDEDVTREFREGLSGVVVFEEEEAEEEEQAEADDETLTDEQRVGRLLEVGLPLRELEGEFASTAVGGRPMRLRAFQVRGHPLSVGNRRVPVWITGERGGGFVAFVDIDHPHFRNFDDEPEDVVLMEVAQNLIVRARNTTATISDVFTELKDRHLHGHAIEPGKLIPEAAQLMHDIQERMAESVEANPPRPWENALTEAERQLTAERITAALRTANVEPTIYSGDYLNYVPASVVPRIVEEWPEAFFDGHLFERPYAEVATPGAKRQTVLIVTGYLNDVAWLTGNPVDPPREQMIRARLSLQLLPNELV